MILDSICSPGHCRLDEYDQNFNENGRYANGGLRGRRHLRGQTRHHRAGPWAAVGVVFERAEAGTLCDGDYPFLDRPTLRMLLGWAAIDQTLRQVIPV